MPKRLTDRNRRFQSGEIGPQIRQESISDSCRNGLFDIKQQHGKREDWCHSLLFRCCCDRNNVNLSALKFRVGNVGGCEACHLVRLVSLNSKLSFQLHSKDVHQLCLIALVTVVSKLF